MCLYYYAAGALSWLADGGQLLAVRGGQGGFGEEARTSPFGGLLSATVSLSRWCVCKRVVFRGSEEGRRGRETKAADSS
jgi:hypothetical protein